MISLLLHYYYYTEINSQMHYKQKEQPQQSIQINGQSQINNTISFWNKKGNITKFQRKRHSKPQFICQQSGMEIHTEKSPLGSRKMQKIYRMSEQIQVKLTNRDEYSQEVKNILLKNTSRCKNKTSARKNFRDKIKTNLSPQSVGQSCISSLSPIKQRRFNTLNAKSYFSNGDIIILQQESSNYQNQTTLPCQSIPQTTNFKYDRNSTKPIKKRLYDHINYCIVDNSPSHIPLQQKSRLKVDQNKFLSSGDRGAVSKTAKQGLPILKKNQFCFSDCRLKNKKKKLSKGQLYIIKNYLQFHKQSIQIANPVIKKRKSQKYKQFWKPKFQIDSRTEMQTFHGQVQTYNNIIPTQKTEPNRNRQNKTQTQEKNVKKHKNFSKKKAKDIFSQQNHNRNSLLQTKPNFQERITIFNNSDEQFEKQNQLFNVKLQSNRSADGKYCSQLKEKRRNHTLYINESNYKSKPKQSKSIIAKQRKNSNKRKEKNYNLLNDKNNRKSFRKSRQKNHSYEQINNEQIRNQIHFDQRQMHEQKVCYGYASKYEQFAAKNQTSQTQKNRQINIAQSKLKQTSNKLGDLSKNKNPKILKLHNKKSNKQLLENYQNQQITDFYQQNNMSLEKIMEKESQDCKNKTTYKFENKSPTIVAPIEKSIKKQSFKNQSAQRKKSAFKQAKSIQQTQQFSINQHDSNQKRRKLWQTISPLKLQTFFSKISNRNSYKQLLQENTSIYKDRKQQQVSIKKQTFPDLIKIPRAEQLKNLMEQYKPLKFRYQQIFRKSESFTIQFTSDQQLYFGNSTKSQEGQIRQGHGVLIKKNSWIQAFFKNNQPVQGIEITAAGKYDGNFRNYRRQGTGQFYWRNGQYYSGEWKKGCKHGSGLWNSNPNQNNHCDSYIGEWRNGRVQGYGIHKTVFNQIYEGQFKNFLKTGKGIQRFPNGDSYEGQYNKGLPSGTGIYRWKSGFYYAGKWSQGVRHEQGIIVSPDEEIVYKGAFLNDKVSGYGEFHDSQGNTYLGMFFNGMKHGKGNLKIPKQNKIIEGQWKSDNQIQQEFQN